MELWDGYNADRTMAGVDISREEEEAGKFPKGLYHAVADIVVRHADGTYLVMQHGTLGSILQLQHRLLRYLALCVLLLI